MLEPISKVKICCITSQVEAKMALDAGASALGFVTEMPSGPGVISESHIQEIVTTIPHLVDTFMLTSKQNADEILNQHAICRTSTIQIVDSIPKAELLKLKERVPAVSLVQVIHVRDESSIDEALSIADFADAILLDSGNPTLSVKSLGGTGLVHDWNISTTIRENLKIPMFLAGGLTPENVAEALLTVKPHGVDVCSGVRTHGKLDLSKLQAFFKAIHATHY